VRRICAAWGRPHVSWRRRRFADQSAGRATTLLESSQLTTLDLGLIAEASAENSCKEVAPLPTEKGRRNKSV
jgi:hypothetical protein